MPSRNSTNIPLTTAYLLENWTTTKVYVGTTARSVLPTVITAKATNSTATAAATGASDELTAFSIVLLVMYVPFLLVAAVGNIMVIIVRLKKFKQSGLSAYKQLICHLSLADIIYATAIPLDMYLRLNNKHWIENRMVCKVIMTSQSAALTASVCILTVMAFERFQGISNPLAHHWSTKKVMIMALVIWLYSYGNFIPYAIALDVEPGRCEDMTDAYPHPEFAKWYTLYQFLSTWLCPLLLIIFFHFGMVFKVMKHRKTINRSKYHSTAVANNGGRSANTKRRKLKMVKILITIVTLFALLTLPIHIWYLWYEFSDRSETEHYSLEVIEIFATFVYMHSAVNPVIYSIMDRSFREELKLLLGLKQRSLEGIRMRVINGATQESY